MGKLIYIPNDDERLLLAIQTALNDFGYKAEFASATENNVSENIHADLAIICSAQPSARRLTMGDVTIDLDAVCAYDKDGKPIHFTPIEFSMLTYLMKNGTRAVSRAELLPAVWGFDNSGGTRVADDTAKRLRKKLASSSLMLETVWNFGFRLRVK